MAPSTLADLLTCEPVTTTLVGVEREYRVIDVAGQATDFRSMINALGLPGGRLDPSDPNAHHLPSGVLLTADGAEAEAAIPPVAVEPGFSHHVSGWAERSEDALVEALPRGTSIEGFSTHLNVSVGGDVVASSRLFARHFGAPMLSLLDLADSPGLLVRPRAGRLELGGDYVDGEQLRVALTFAVAAARCCDDVVRSRRRHPLPSPVARRLERAKDRPGWFIAREGPIDRSVLDEAWSLVRDDFTVDIDASEVAAVDAVVQGHRPLPSENVTGPDHEDITLRSPFASLHAREQGSLRVEVRAISWAAVAFDVHAGRPTFQVFVPRRWLPSFLERLDAGALRDALTAPPGRRERSGPRVVHERFDARMVVPPEPAFPRRWLTRAPEVAGALAGCAAVAAAVRFWPW
jgi:hypothetical protein